MALTQIIQFSSEPLLEVNDTIERAVKALKEVKPLPHYVLGTQVQHKGVFQITSELDGIQDHVNLEATPAFNSFIKSVRSFCGEPHNIFHVAFNQSVFGSDGPATANVVEYAQTSFPASRVTPEFQKQVEEDFLRFDEIFSKGAKGTVSGASGWVLEEQEHENIQGEKAKCFFVIKGWESMDHFEQSTKNDAFKKAIPILFAWNAPSRLVGVCFAV